MYLNKSKLKKPQAIYKKRYLKKTYFKIQLFSTFNIKKTKSSNTTVYFKNYDLIELRWYKFFLLKLKKITRKKKCKSYVWFVSNHAFSKKSKNSRMGKGKGKQIRYVSKHSVLKPLFVFKKLSIIRVKKFVMFLNKKCKNNFFYF